MLICSIEEMQWVGTTIEEATSEDLQRIYSPSCDNCSGGYCPICGTYNKNTEEHMDARSQNNGR